MSLGMVTSFGRVGVRGKFVVDFSPLTLALSPQGERGFGWHWLSNLPMAQAKACGYIFLLQSGAQKAA
jgi:hypothetical protein